MSVLVEKFGPLGYRDFRRLLISRITTSLGYWLSFIALFSIFVFESDIGPLGVSVFALVQLAPSVLSGFVFGPFADKLDRRKLLFLCEMLSAVLVLSLVFVESVLLSYVVLLAMGLVKSLASPTQKAMVAQIIDEDELLSKANGLMNAVGTTAQIAGPGLGGLLLIVVNAKLLFVIDSVSYVLSGLLILSMSAYTIEEEVSRTHLDQIVEGFEYVRGSGLLLAIITTNALLFSMTGLLDAMLPLFIRENLSGTATDFGVLAGVIATGSLFGSVLMGRYGDRISAENGVIWGIFMVGGAIVGLVAPGLYFHTSPSQLQLYAFAFVDGLGNSIAIGYSFTLMQQRAEDEFMGRTFGIFDTATSGTEIFLVLVGSIVVTQVGILQVYLSLGVGLLLVSASLLVSKLRTGSIGTTSRSSSG